MQPEPRHQGDVELACTIGQHLYALEHTKLEAYPGQIRDGVDFVRALEPIELACAGHMPKTAWFQLVVPSEAFTNLASRQIGSMQPIIAAWVKEVAPAIKLHPQRGGAVRANLNGVPFPVTLYAYVGVPAFYGRLQIARYTPENLEERRQESMNRSLDKKLPKLQAWSDRARTVLILEDDDIALTNHFSVAEKLEKGLRGRPFEPDFIFLVMTCVPTYFVFPLVEFGAHELGRNRPFPHTELESESLQDILNV